MNLVKTETVVVNNAPDLYKACKDHLETTKTEGACTHYLHSFEFTSKLKSRPNTSKWTIVPDTRKIHSLTNVVGTSVINIKNLLCCCCGCMHGGTECQNKICPAPWKGYDLSLKKIVSTNFRNWMVCNICKNYLDVNHPDYWTEHLNQMSEITIFSELRDYIESNPIPELNVNIDTKMYESDKNILDFVALHYLPSDAPDSYAPVKIIGDGNCFPCSVSYVAFCTQNKHAEIRTQIVYEGVLNKDLYLNNEYLSEGATNFYSRGTLCDQYTMYSDNYNPNTPLNVEAIYMCELLDICKDGAYMGIWQLFQVANVLQHPVKSVYPEGGNVNIRKDLGHDIHCQNQCANTRETVTLMWTPMQVGNGRPCHFVPLLKVVSKTNIQ